MPLSNTLRSLSNLGKDLVDTQKNEWLADAEIRLRIISGEATTKLHRTAMIAAGMITGGLLALAAAIVLR